MTVALIWYNTIDLNGDDAISHINRKPVVKLNQTLKILHNNQILNKNFVEAVTLYNLAVLFDKSSLNLMKYDWLKLCSNQTKFKKYCIIIKS